MPLCSYSVYYEHDPESGRYLATVPALGVTTDGATPDEARAMAKDAIESKVAVLRQIGQPVPEDVQIEHITLDLSA